MIEQLLVKLEEMEMEKTTKTAKFLERKIDFSGNKLAFTFDGKPSQMFNPDSLPNGIRSKLVLWGLNEKLGNASANLAKNRETDKAVAVTNRLWEALCAGNWEVTLSAEEREAARLEAIRKEKQQRMLDLIEACRRIGYSEEKVLAGVASQCAKHNWSDQDNAVLALLAQPAIQKHYVSLLAERAREKAGPAPEIDLNEMFG